MARDIDRKLRLTAVLLGTVARKDLAAAFRRVNANTSFDIGRADKWLQGRAQPRERQVYEDWAKVLELDRPGLDGRVEKTSHSATLAACVSAAPGRPASRWPGRR